MHQNPHTFAWPWIHGVPSPRVSSRQIVQKAVCSPPLNPSRAALGPSKYSAQCRRIEKSDLIRHCPQFWKKRAKRMKRKKELTWRIRHFLTFAKTSLLTDAAPQNFSRINMLIRDMNHEMFLCSNLNALLLDWSVARAAR